MSTLAFHYEDFSLGQRFRSPTLNLDAAAIKSFAASYDPQPQHLDEAAAARGFFGGLIASGWHTAALVMRLLVEHYLSAEASLGSPGLDEIRWPYPVRPGDTLRVRATVVESRRSLSKPDRGIVKTVVEATNSGGATVMRATAIN
ncbi:MAG: MaoC family dehydratase, partial [Acetobacteraceae bacterium]